MQNEKSERIQDHYIFDKKLGQGSFGEVIKAIKIDTGEEFAIKIIAKDQLREEDVYTLENEVAILTQIDHPNIVKFYEIYDDETSFYMVFELMTGGELFERIIEKDHYSEKEAVETIKPIVDALRYCHQMNISHRDLKPQNLLYSTPDKNATIKITDFGLARVMDEKIMFTQCGTPGFIAPEIIFGNGYDMMIDY